MHWNVNNLTLNFVYLLYSEVGKYSSGEIYTTCILDRQNMNDWLNDALATIITHIPSCHQVSCVDSV